MRNFRVKYEESSIGFKNLAYLQSIENKCNSVLIQTLNFISPDPEFVHHLIKTQFYFNSGPDPNQFLRTGREDNLNLNFKTFEIQIDGWKVLFWFRTMSDMSFTSVLVDHASFEIPLRWQGSRVGIANCKFQN